MTTPFDDDSSAPNPQQIMAAVIRLMALCSMACDEDRLRTLLRLLRRLREHPALVADVAVRASLVEAHAIWVARLPRGCTLACEDGEFDTVH